MNDWNITCRHHVESVVDNNFVAPAPVGHGGRWRLWDRMADYARPWQELSWRDVQQEYRQYPSPAKEYIKHMCRCFEGEVALAYYEWEWTPEPVPRAAVYWHPQFAKLPAQRAAVGALYNRAVTRGRGVVSDDIDLRMDIGDTTIIRHADVGHWRLEGGVVTLAQLFRDFGEEFTAMDIMCWYFHAPKVAKKRAHPVGSAVERAAAHERKAVYGTYGKRH